MSPRICCQPPLIHRAEGENAQGNSSGIHVRFICSSLLLSLPLSAEEKSHPRSGVVLFSRARTVLFFRPLSASVEQRNMPGHKGESLKRRDHPLHCHHIQISAAGLASRAGALFDPSSGPASDHPGGSRVPARSLSTRYGENSWERRDRGVFASLWRR